MQRTGGGQVIGDLHCHTRFSDGSMGIDDLIYNAKRSGLDFVAVTDHDTMAGIRRAQQLGKRIGIGVIAGTEISAYDRERKRRVHLLCYLPHNPDRLVGMMKRTTQAREVSLRASLKKVMRQFPLMEESVQKFSSGSASLFSAHIMNALMDLGYADSIYGTLYHQILSSKGSCYVPHPYPDVREAAKRIRIAGGICVLAHPSVYNSIELMQELAQEGLIDGIERYHPRVKKQDIAQIDAVLEEYNLIATGGTDFHGANSQHPNPLGTCLTTQESLERIFKLSKEK